MNEKEFGRLLEDYLSDRRDEMKKKFDRVLPTGELLFNRFDKGRYLNCGEGSSVYDTSIIMGDVRIGKHVWIGPYSLLEGINGRLTIGDFVSINTGVCIYTHDSTKYYVSGGQAPFRKGDVTIGDNTVIGTMSMVGCNVKIGSHCVIGAHSMVVADVPDYSIAAGVPARIIGQVKCMEDGTVDFQYFRRERRDGRNINSSSFSE